MELLQKRRRHASCRRIIAAAALSLAALFLLTRNPTGQIYLVVPPRRLSVGLGAVQVATTSTTAVVQRGRPEEKEETEAVLLPDWEVLVMLRSAAATAAAPGAGNATCVFRGGPTAPARALGRLPASGRHAYVCVMPRPVRRRQPFHAPLVVSSSSSPTVAAATAGGDGAGRREMLRWSGKLVYESAVVDGGDVLVFAKGINPRQGVNHPAEDIRCVYYHRDTGVDDVVASLPAATSAQQVFRCPPPPTPVTSSRELAVTLAVAGEEPVPSLATYNPPRGGGSSATSLAGSRPPIAVKRLICACTMVRDVAKFLHEWVVYHAAVGVDRFFLYDNGSEDDLADQVRQLRSAGFDVSTVVWPWTKAQEAGFSHAAAVHRDSCEWMAFIDVDEFIFSPHWVQSEKPEKSMLQSVVSVEENVGQVSLGCTDFGPSGRTKNPEEGVTQGYTCRRRTEERHKSLVRLSAVDRSLVNSVHHFGLRPEFQSAWNRRVRVNHYKYQAWEEFKVKFRRRVSTYVVDWTDPVNLQSKDRTPGLGIEAVEQAGWAQKFCEVNDTLLRDTTQRWFGVGFGNKLTHQQQIGTTGSSLS